MGLYSIYDGTKNKLGGGAKQQAPKGEGARIETPKASRGRGMGRGFPPPHPTRGSGGAS